MLNFYSIPGSVFQMGNNSITDGMTLLQNPLLKFPYWGYLDAPDSAFL